MTDGLGETEAAWRLTRDGPNELPFSRPRVVLCLLRDVVSEPMFLLLVACGVIYAVLGDRHEELMLPGLVFVVMGITFVQQRRTERSQEALCDMSSPRALVMRDDQARRIAGHELVYGDIVLLAEGDRVPGDMHLTESSNLAVVRSLLTGESAPVVKQAGPMTDGAGAVPGDSNPAQVISGRLTANRMAVRRLWSESAVYDRQQAGSTPRQEGLNCVMEFAMLASHRRAFDPMESAIADAGKRLPAGTEHLHANWTLVDDYP